MPKTSLRIRFSTSVWTGLLCVCCAGCIIVPVRVQTKTISVSGVAGKKLDLGFIKAGATRREEVEQKLGWVDTGVKDDNFFVGRWAESSWGAAWAAGGGYSAAGGWNRAWTTHNLIVDFDDNGVVLQTSQLPDKDVIEAFSERISKEPVHPLDLSVPIRVPVEYFRSGKSFPGTLILSKDDFSFLEDREMGSKVAYDFKTQPENLVHLKLGNWVTSNSSHPENMPVTINFKRRTPVGSKFVAQMDLPATMILLKYIRQTQSGSSLK